MSYTRTQSSVQIDDGTIRIGDVTIGAGSSIYHHGLERVLWFVGIDDGYIRFRTLSGPFSIRLDVFEEYVTDGILQIER